MEDDTTQVQPEVVEEGGEPSEEGPSDTEVPSEEAEQPSETPTEAGDVKPQPRVFSQEEVSKIISAEQKRVAALSKQAAELMKALEEERRQRQMMEMSRQSEGEYAQVLQAIAMEEARQVREAESQGLDPTPIRKAYEAQRMAVSAMHKLYLDQQKAQVEEHTRRVHQIALQYGLTEADYPTLFNALDPEATAKAIKLERDLEAVRNATASQVKQPQEFTAPTGTPMGGRTRDQLWADLASGKLSPTSEEARKLFES